MRGLEVLAATIHEGDDRLIVKTPDGDRLSVPPRAVVHFYTRGEFQQVRHITGQGVAWGIRLYLGDKRRDIKGRLRAAGGVRGYRDLVQQCGRFLVLGIHHGASACPQKTAGNERCRSPGNRSRALHCHAFSP